MTTKLINYTGWTIVLSASLYFVYSNALHYFSYNSNSFGPGYWPIAPYLLTHIVGGMTALLLGPFQFIAVIRKKYTRVHRTMGKIYLCSVVIGASASFYLSINKLIITDHAVTYGTGLAGLAFTWLLTGGMAYWAVRNKNFVQHREWMIRSYVITCAFTTFRLVYNILTINFHTPEGPTAEIMAWACWAFPLLVTEAFLQANKIQRASKALAKKKELNKPHVTITTVSTDKSTI